MSKKRINYSLRLAKNIERKMLCETFRCLSEFRLVETYKYIGFGSYYFVDFALFHKALNICSMLSIEKGAMNKDLLPRFESNRPYKCIDLRPGQSSEILPQLNWNEHSIVWLDYDGDLIPSVLADIKTFCTKATTESILVITVKADPGNDLEEDDDGNKLDRLTRLKLTIGEGKIPFQIPVVVDGQKKMVPVANKHLDSWGTARVFREIINNEIIDTLENRNGVLREEMKVQYKQLFNFHYSDNTKMLTVGGIIYSQEQEPKVNKCSFERFPFIRFDENPYKIEVPYLTYRELRKLDSELPTNDIDSLKAVLPGVPEKDIKNYLDVYRYFPTFAEAEL